MTPRQAFELVDSAIARATNLPVSYVAVNDALRTLHVALDKLDGFEAGQKCEVHEDKHEAEASGPQEKGEEI